MALHVPCLPDVEWRWFDKRFTPAQLARIMGEPTDDDVDLACALIAAGVATWSEGDWSVDEMIWTHGELVWAPSRDEGWEALMRWRNTEDERKAAEITRLCRRYRTRPSDRIVRCSPPLARVAG